MNLAQTSKTLEATATNPLAKLAANAKKRKLTPKITTTRRTILRQQKLKAMPEKSSFPFLKLPAEIRNMIYHAAFVDPHDGQIECYDDGLAYGNTTIFCNAVLAIVNVCRQIRNEGLPVFYQNNVFTLNAVAWLGKEDRPSRNKAPMTSINLESVRHLRIVVPYNNTHGNSIGVRGCYLSTIHVLRIFAKCLGAHHRLINLLIESPILETDILDSDRPDILDTTASKRCSLKDHYDILSPLRQIHGINSVHLHSYNPAQRSLLDALRQQMMRRKTLESIATPVTSQKFDLFLSTPSYADDNTPRLNLHGHHRTSPIMGPDLIRTTGPDPAKCISTGVMPEPTNQAAWVLYGPTWSAFGWMDSALSRKYVNYTLGRLPKKKGQGSRTGGDQFGM